MEFKYSQNLIEETIKCFKEEHNLDVSVDQANEYLDSLSGLFLAFAGRETSANSLRVAEVSCVLIPSEMNSVFPKPEAGLR